MSVIISSVGLGIPDQCYTQEYIFNALKVRKVFWDLFSSSEIEKRRFCIDPAEMEKATPQDLHNNYQKYAVELSIKAILDCLSKTDISPKDIDHLVFVSCTGAFISPAPSWEIAYILGMKEDLIHTPLSGCGCAGSGPGLRRAWEYETLHQHHKALVVTCEISNAAYHPSSDLGVIIGNSIFADGASCYLLEGDFYGDRSGLSISNFSVLHKYEDRYTVAMVWEDARYKLILPHRTSELSTPIAIRVIDKLLAGAALNIDSIKKWIVHSGGKSILDDLSTAAKIPKSKLEESYWVWKTYGNMSSATVGFAVERMLSKRDMHSGDRVVILALGAGFTAEGILCEWRD